MCSLVLLGYIRLVKYKLCVWLHWDIPPDQKLNTTREVQTHLILGYSGLFVTHGQKNVRNCLSDVRAPAGHQTQFGQIASRVRGDRTPKPDILYAKHSSQLT
jgi:hypothetical protein